MLVRSNRLVVHHRTLNEYHCSGEYLGYGLKYRSFGSAMDSSRETPLRTYSPPTSSHLGNRKRRMHHILVHGLRRKEGLDLM